MLNKIKKFLSNFPLIYDFIKKLKQVLLNNKIFYIINKNDIDKFNFKKSSYNTFNKKNFEKIFINYLDCYIFITDKNIIKKYPTEKLKSLFDLIKNEKADLAYDGNCPHYTEIISVKLLKKYSNQYNIKYYPIFFYYFYNEHKFIIKNIGENHREYNFNGTFILPEGGKTIGDGGDVSFRLNFIPDLTNKTFLDIGCEEGYSVFNALTKNALHAKGLNIEEDTEYDFFPNYMRPKGVTLRKRIDIETTINFLKRVYKLENSKKIFFEYKNIYNLIKENYDFVFCFGVLYHLKNPYLAIENLYKITNDTLVLETQGSFSNSNDYSGILDMDDGFVRHSPEALKFLLKKAGFRKVEILFNGVSKIKKISNIVLKATKNV
ncbi:DUF1698 domain-containing protein [Pelagibacteraceae bacterium]|jgi:hypothetical protein|nr:DUF1698 domain-containing protein [Pelagibacteraceae bacterium]